MSEEIQTSGTENSTPAASSAPASAPSTASSDGQVTASGKSDVAPAAGVPAGIVPPEYTPNLKYKVLDQEKEFDEFLKPVVKTKDVEEKLRDLYTKAHGLEAAKPRYEQTKTQLQEVSGKHQALVGDLNQLSQYVREGDFTSYFQALRIPEQAIMQWVHQRIKQSELPPEQQAVYNERQQMKQQNQMLQQQAQQYQQQFEQAQVQARTFELDNVLSRPEVKTAMSQYDSQLGQGSFRNEIIQRGAAIYHATGQDPSAEEVVQKTLAFMGLLRQPTGMQQAGNIPNGQQGTAPRQAPPVIPNVTGTSQSPARKTSRSLDDLKKRARELDATA